VVEVILRCGWVVGERGLIEVGAAGMGAMVMAVIVEVVGLA
jgi:hypothetical protein